MAARISGINLPEQKNVEIALTYLYGVGFSRSKEILKYAKIDPRTKVKDLDAKDIKLLQDVITEKYKTENDLRREVRANIKRLKDIGAYRGMRHMKHLPVRGQKTKTNSRTVRGNVRKTVGSGRRKVGLK
ncbi:MAG: 30S ribosomal protein S13 [Patescibacteria group bacterium]|nr:30S ribosomal protein S13 [Patescibacteria group bacterium]MDE2437852.1 30S ribosomal protein S13 [Patescibacteria group bacterium]